jgi:hypothetical protein
VRDGYVVLPTPLGACPEMLAQVQHAFDQHLLESPELRNPRPTDPTWKNVLGGFAAMGNPSSFHHPFVRKMREMCEAVVLDADALPLQGRKLEQCYDRVMRRVPGERTDVESWHRDEAKHTLQGDDIFGGWLNCDAQRQHFSCAGGTHVEEGARSRNDGFSKITSHAEKARYSAIAENGGGPVVIPPGHMLIFYERLVHEVLKTTAKCITRRIFLGWRATMADEPLFGAARTTSWIDDQTTPLIKSGQKPAIYPTAYYNFPRNFQRLTNFSNAVFVPPCLYSHVVRSGDNKGVAMVRVHRNMKGLREYELPLHAPYDEHEIAVLWPSRRWKLFTFDSPGERVGFWAVTADAW